tara:strand:+ start:817 stop:1317 length:501 start_codon:yes stop_codon:yes gene_type:complete
MGFDISGINPHINKPDTEYKYYREDKDIFKEEDKEIRDKYFKEMEEYYEANPGVYFRNNVWWWRPLWSFVCNRCQDILTKEDIRHGSFNDGWEIEGKKAYRIGMRLKKLVEDGEVALYAAHHEVERDNLKDSDDEDEQFVSNYPFNTENVDKFATFCIQSGGFMIC